MILRTEFLRRAAMLLVAASTLAACCTPTITPQSVQPGAASCGAYFTISNHPAGGGQR